MADVGLESLTGDIRGEQVNSEVAADRSRILRLPLRAQFLLRLLHAKTVGRFS